MFRIAKFSNASALLSVLKLTGVIMLKVLNMQVVPRVFTISG